MEGKIVNKDFKVGHATILREMNIVRGMEYPPEPKGQKLDDGKVRMDLLMCGCAKSLEQVAKVLTFGAKKYADDNWRLVPNAQKRYHAALHRHLNAYYQGEKLDKETGLSHLAHALCCLIFLLEFEVTNENT